MEIKYSKEERKKIVERLLIYGGYCPKCGDFLFPELTHDNIIQCCINPACNYSDYYLKNNKENPSEEELIDEFIKGAERNVAGKMIPSGHLKNSMTYIKVGSMMIPEDSVREQKIKTLQNDYIKRLLGGKYE